MKGLVIAQELVILSLTDLAFGGEGYPSTYTHEIDTMIGAVH